MIYQWKFPQNPNMRVEVCKLVWEMKTSTNRYLKKKSDLYCFSKSLRYNIKDYDEGE